MFSTFSISNFNFSFILILLSANAFNLDQSKILPFGKESTKIKALADHNSNVVQMMISVTDKVENIDGKEENVKNQNGF